MCSVFSHIYEPFAEDHDAMDWGNPGVLRICNNKVGIVHFQVKISWQLACYVNHEFNFFLLRTTA